MFGALYYGEAYFAGHMGDADNVPPAGATGLVAPAVTVGTSIPAQRTGTVAG